MSDCWVCDYCGEAVAVCEYICPKCGTHWGGSGQFDESSAILETPESERIADAAAPSDESSCQCGRNPGGPCECGRCGCQS